MITHVVLFKLLAGVAPDNAAVRAFHAAMLELPRQIPQIRSWRCGFSITGADVQAADYVLVAEFENQDALYQYFEHPLHLDVLKSLEGLAELVFGDIPA